MTGRLTAIALAAAALAAPGCISSTRYGTDQITTLASGATEAQVIRQHGAPDNIITFVAYPDISEFEACWKPDAAIKDTWQARDRNSPEQTTRLLMVATDYGKDAR